MARWRCCWSLGHRGLSVDALRVEIRLAAIIANLHDVVIILGFFAFFQWEFSLSVLAAVLAVLGYSVNESVVVFDRMRENFRKRCASRSAGSHRSMRLPAPCRAPSSPTAALR